MVQVEATAGDQGQDLGQDHMKEAGSAVVEDPDPDQELDLETGLIEMGDIEIEKAHVKKNVLNLEKSPGRQIDALVVSQGLKKEPRRLMEGTVMREIIPEIIVPSLKKGHHNGVVPLTWMNKKSQEIRDLLVGQDLHPHIVKRIVITLDIMMVPRVILRVMVNFGAVHPLLLFCILFLSNPTCKRRL